MKKDNIPQDILDLLPHETPRVDDVGQSGSGILIFSDCVLKVRPVSDQAENEYRAMTFLEGRLNAPRVIARRERDGVDYLLMTRLPGLMACDQYYMARPDIQAGLLARAVKLLDRVDVTSCPIDQTLDVKLRDARHRVERGLVDTRNTQPGTFGPGGFRGPQELLAWLETHRPREDPAFSHGDLCLPNIIIDGDDIGFIDLSMAGVADRWNDIAILYRSLRDNYAGKYARPGYPPFDPGLLFDELDIQPDWDKINYYILLDELF